MCTHDMVMINEVKICRKCGLTICPDGRVFFDKAVFLKRWRKYAKT